jgi:type I restriction enzyme S subunit
MIRKKPEPLLPLAHRPLKPFPAYKGSGVEWLGEIPAHWEVAPVYARYEVALGKMLDAKRVTGESSGRYLRNIDVQWDAVNTEGLPEMDFAPWERDRYAVSPGDLLVCEGGEVGRTAIWRGEIADCFYQKAIHRVRPRSEKDAPRFFYYLMHTLAKRGVFAAGGNPNTIDHLTAVQLRHYRLPFAPSNEQRVIAAFLDRETARIDGLVAKKERLIELLQEKRAALITRAVTKGFGPNVPMKDSGVEWLGEIPAHWDTWRLKHVSGGLTVGVVVNPSHYVTPSGVPFLRGADVSEGCIVLKNVQYMSEESNREHHKSTLRQGDLVSIRVGYPGVTAVVPAELEGSNCASLLITKRSKRVNSDLLCYLMNSALGKAQFKMLQDGAAQEQINVSDAVDFIVPLPPPDEQATIVAYLDGLTSSIDTLLAKVREAIDCLKELRTTLIAAAVTGKIDVRDPLDPEPILP